MYVEKIPLNMEKSHFPLFLLIHRIFTFRPLQLQVYFQPYFMLYGEVFADKIDPPCGGVDQPACITGKKS